MSAIPFPIPTVHVTEFADYLQHWRMDLRTMPLEELIGRADTPDHVAVFCVDLLNGFCHEGQLQSDRVRSIIDPIVSLFERCYVQGVRHFVLPQDEHPVDAAEFSDYPVHCVRGTSEAQTVPELLRLPFSDLFTVIPKRSISSSVCTGLDAWLAAHPHVTHRVVVGNCTDLCTYQLAMHLKLTANVRNAMDPVVVPADCVATYDVPVEQARQLGIPAHPGDFFHAVFLYHMHLNGVQVVDRLD
ncbi:MAG TPA: isochorismatase family cysteine hydrolase [Chthonomonadales bacterium]|nr:isochorismatase family cysteine hydrolase [Chthonomonadales bacterium]